MKPNVCSHCQATIVTEQPPSQLMVAPVPGSPTASVRPSTGDTNGSEYHEPSGDNEDGGSENVKKSKWTLLGTCIVCALGGACYLTVGAVCGGCLIWCALSSLGYLEEIGQKCLPMFIILATEFTLRWNDVTEVNSVTTAGQLIPLVISLGTLLQCIITVGLKMFNKEDEVVAEVGQGEEKDQPGAETNDEKEEKSLVLAPDKMNEAVSAGGTGDDGEGNNSGTSPTVKKAGQILEAKFSSAYLQPLVSTNTPSKGPTAIVQ
ncbi:hypothetical protein B0H67DRAFT_648954 [Lasiosphaeris hirsuta]|uniref:Transmembrane protein n=1 Tax=Lasiosphaeris hirsuta TaxID=260670 RepID=A0AA40DKD8_9PEZI|nr:hypothetical protein B0H67DRAFT_648954 [Lasiosphaeris hirsuta]